jgi:exopolysaccharide biosynthesis polyprenyl glycosylphosphotransferase
VLHRVTARLDPLWRRGFRFLFVLDAAALYLAMVLINLLRFGLTWPSFSLSYYLAGFGVATLIHVGIGYLVGLYEREPRLGPRPWLPRTMLAMVIGVAVQGLAFVLLDRYLMPRLNLLIFMVVGAVCLTANRYLSRMLAQRRHGPAKVLLVGLAAECKSAESHLGESDWRAITVGSTSDIGSFADAVSKSGATDVLLLSTSAYSDIFPQPLNELEASGVDVFQRVSAAQTLLGLHEIREVAGMPFVSLRSQSLPAYKYRLKRLLDLLVLAVGSPAILFVAGATALYVRVLAGAPVLYRQVRVGQQGEPFVMVKFRTMRSDAESGGAILSSANDPRVIRGLGFLRSTRLDEVPQLWHVFRGQMSIVGPRPERPEFTVELAKQIPGYGRRFELPPGLTGLAQVNGRYSTAAEYKIGYDLQYVADWSLLLDVEIMARTVWVILSRRV